MDTAKAFSLIEQIADYSGEAVIGLSAWGECFNHPDLIKLKIAEKWNAVGGNKGYVTRFEVGDSFCGKYEVQTVGRSYHQELWIPADELENFNNHIIGLIKVTETFSGNV